MMALMRAGLIAAALQLVIVVLAYVIVMTLERFYLTHDTSLAVTSLLSWFYCLAAIGIVMVCDGYIDVTTQEIRRKSAIVAVSRSVPPARYLLSLELLTCFGLLALLFREPPAGMIELAEFLHLPNLNSAMWPGIISVGLAGFGANARATFEAQEPSNSVDE